jgi:hypothetical protein
MAPTDKSHTLKDKRKALYLEKYQKSKKIKKVRKLRYITRLVVLCLAFLKRGPHYFLSHTFCLSLFYFLVKFAS